MISRHRLVLGAILIGNAVAFAGVDPPTRLATALLVVLLVADLRSISAVPNVHRLALIAVAALVVIQLVPAPLAVRRVLEPGFVDVMAGGWAPLSLAPWATVSAAASIIVAIGIALTAARVAATRSGLPVLLALLASTGVVFAVLGLATVFVEPWWGIVLFALSVVLGLASSLRR